MVIVRKKIAGLSPLTLERFVLRARREAGLRKTVNVLVTGSREVRALNRRFRGKDKPTDVLSFPALHDAPEASRKLAGELAISADIAKRNSLLLGHALAEEIKILVLHGILHLAGYDHETDNGDMAQEEVRLRRKLRLNAGLIERTRISPEREKPTPLSAEISRAKAARRRSA